MKIGGYEIVRLLGKGGMSEVYEVERPGVGSRHALKLFTYGQDDPEVRERFLVEGRLLAKLNHPRIVKVTDIGTDAASGRPFFVMDLVCDEHGETRSLASVDPGSVDEPTVGRWYDDLREGLAYIHANGVVHRDLKLQNVLIGPDGHAVLADFGVSRVFAAKGDGARIVDGVETLVKVREGRSLVMGSVGYLAPELELGVEASPQSDWYALGVIVYRLLTGTWCDARTDVLKALDSYEPAWRRIVPALLHSNPQGRACLSYAAEREADREAAESERENRQLRETGRVRSARLTAVVASALALVVAAVFAVTFVKLRGDLRLARAEARMTAVGRSPYDFNELFRIPAEATADAQLDAAGEVLVPSWKDLETSRIDALVLTHGLFSRLRAGEITAETLLEKLDALRDGCAEDADEPFDAWPEGYVPGGDDETLHWLLNAAVERLEALLDR